MRGPGRVRLVFTLLLLTAFTFTALDLGKDDGGPIGALRRGVDTVFGPLQDALGGAASSAGEALGGLPRLGDYRDENDALRKQNDELKRRLDATADDQRRAAELDCLLRTKDVMGLTLVPAQVSAIGTDLPFQETVVLDAGDRDQGVAVGRAVFAPRGLVGRITRVGPYTSTVALLTDRTFSVGAKIARVGSLVILKGGGRGAPMTLELARLDGDGQIRVGDVLVTSGSETFPPGLPIGRVSKVNTRSGQLVRTAEVVPFVDPTALDVLSVVTGAPRTAPRIGVAPSPSPGAQVAGCTVTPPPAPKPSATPSGSPSGTPSASPS